MIPPMMLCISQLSSIMCHVFMITMKAHLFFLSWTNHQSITVIYHINYNKNPNINIYDTVSEKKKKENQLSLYNSYCNLLLVMIDLFFSGLL